MVPASTIDQEQADKLWALRDLPPFPWIATKVMQLFASHAEDVEIRRLIELIRADASLSSELLRRANSPLYGLQSRISSLQHAVVILGLDQVKTLSMTIGISAYLRAALRLAVLRKCWRHSLTCALLAEELAPACGIQPDQAYTAGLLHDIGRFALLVKYPQAYADLLSVVVENKFHLLESERDLFDIDHCEAGAWLAKQWGFPQDLALAVSQHHAPPEANKFDLLRLVHVCCRLADSLGFEVIAPSRAEQPEDIFAELPKRALALVQSDVTVLRERLTRKVNALE
jgi:putative nucleotidyltransferase with HDIG domain